MNLTKRALFTGVLAVSIAAGGAVPALAQQRVEIQFWHAMGGVLGTIITINVSTITTKLIPDRSR